MERSSINYGTRKIDFSIDRSSTRKKTVSIIVDPDDGVSLKAPSDVDTEFLNDIARQKGKWIVQKIKTHNEGRYDILQKEFITGESIQYLGRNYILKIISDPLLSDGGFCRLKGKYLECYLSNTNNKAACTSAIKNWYISHAQKRISERVELYAKRMSLSYGSVLIREQKKRWGSCDSKGNLRFNWQIITAPLKLIDYVVVHELAHIRVPNHSPAFWKVMEVVMPDYKIRKEKLRLIGVQLTSLTDKLY